MFDLKSFRTEVKVYQRDICNILDIKQPVLSRYEKHMDLPKAHINKLIQEYGEELINRYIIKQPERNQSNSTYGSKHVNQENVIGEVGVKYKVKAEMLEKQVEQLENEVKWLRSLIEKR